VSWADLLTGRRSVSLGEHAYLQALAAAGLRVVGQLTDEGGNHYYDTARALQEPST
jgi:hypothetical protein